MACSNMANQVVTSLKLDSHQHNGINCNADELDSINCALKQLKIKDVPSLKLVTMNMGKGDKSVPSGTKIRRPTVELVINSEYPDVLFVQEIMAANSPHWLLNIKRHNYEHIQTGNESGVLWNTQTLDFRETIEAKHKDLIIARMPNSKFPQECLNEIPARTSVVCLKHKHSSHYVMVASWHGPWRAKKEARIATFGALQEFCLRIRTKHFGRLTPPPPIVIGGDFNLSLESSDISVHPDFMIPSYQPSERRYDRVGDETIDFFVHTKDIKLKDTSSLEMNQSEASAFTQLEVARTTEDTCEWQDRLRSLDHDPVVAYLIYKPPY